MEITTAHKGNALTITLRGKMDAVTAPEFDKKFSDWVNEKETVFIVNFDEVEYISSAGLRSLLAAAKQLKARNCRLMIAGLKGPVKEVFELSGFFSIFEILDSEEEALARAK